MINLFLALLFLSSSSFVSASPNYQLGKKIQKAGDIKKSLELFKTVKKESPYYIDALFELQKHNYATNDWKRVFGLGYYYRTLLNENKSFFRSKMISLEVLALAKHCQWGIASTIISKSKSKFSDHKDFLNDLDIKVSLMKEYSNVGKAKNESQFLTTDKEIAWPISKNVSEINPYRLAMKVRNQCR